MERRYGVRAEENCEERGAYLVLVSFISLSSIIHNLYLSLQLMSAIQVAERAEKPPLSELFTDVYDVPTANLREQEAQLRQTVQRHGDDYPSDVPL